MKLKIINPDSSMKKEQLMQREIMLKSVARNDTIISMECPQNNNVDIDSFLDISIASSEIVSIALKAEKEGFDAVGIYCFSDPAINACREALTIPVIGGGQSAFQIACGLGYTYSLITTDKDKIPSKYEFARTTGIDFTRLVSIRSIDINFSDIEENTDNTICRLIDTAKKCIEKDGASVIILGCLSFASMGKIVSEKINAPVVDPAFAIVNMAELLYNQGISHSKISYPMPKKLERTWNKGSIHLN